MSLPRQVAYQGQDLMLQVHLCTNDSLWFDPRRAGLMPSTVATLAIRCMTRAMDLLRGRRLAEEQRRRDEQGVWEGRVRKEMVQERKDSPGAE